MRPIWKLSVLAAGLATACTGSVRAQAVLGVLRLGDGVAPLSGTSAAVFIDEYTVTGTGITSTAVLTGTVNVSGAITFSNSGNSTSEGQLNLSTDGRYLAFAGYNAVPGTAGIAATTGTATQRVVALVDGSGVVTSTLMGTAFASGGNPRSAFTTNGTDIWAASSNTGIGYTSFGSGTTTQLSAAPTNTRVVTVSGGQLYTSASSGTFVGVSTVGTGLPTTSGQTTTALPGFPTAAGPSNYDYVFASPTTLYIADDRTVATGTGGGIEKWVLSAGTWGESYSSLVATGVGMRSLALAGDGTLYGISTANTLVSAIDTGTGFSFNTLATAATNEAFRGTDFFPTPVPEPGTMALIGFAAVGFAGRRIRRKKMVV